MKPTTFPVLALASALVGCTVGELGDSTTTPAAPSQLAATPAEGGVHLTWRDNSADELHFMVMRMMADGGDSDMKAVGTVGPNVTAFHDATVESGMTYMYIVAAMGDGGEADSNSVELVAP